MKQVLIIPDRKNIEESLAIAKEYNLGFEYDDFFIPDILDDEKKLEEIINQYKAHELPEFTTVHGAFFDVIPFSADAKIREVSTMRIEQSIGIAKEIGAKAVIFHTNYDPFLNTTEYIESWIEKNTIFWSKELEAHPEINIYLENMFDVSPAILEALSDNLSKYPNYGVCLDYAHATISKVPADLWAKHLSRYVKHVHINDNDLISDLHLAWGDGKIIREKFYEVYKKHLEGASVLIETTSIENQKRSIKVLKNEGFF